MPGSTRGAFGRALRFGCVPGYTAAAPGTRGFDADTATQSEDCQESDDDVPQPFRTREFSGRFNVRLPPSLHRELVMRAAEEGVSLNQLVTTALAKSVA